MPYEKQNFTDGTVLKAEHLNHIEDGIAELAEGGGSGGGGKLYEHLVTIYKSGDGLTEYACRVNFSFIKRSATPITSMYELMSMLSFDIDGVNNVYSGYVYDAFDSLSYMPVFLVNKMLGDEGLEIITSNWTGVELTPSNSTITDTVKEIV